MCVSRNVRFLSAFVPTFTNSECRKLLQRGVFAVNKIKNLTSVEVLETIKEILLKGIEPRVHPASLKVGHGGTLDSTATGVLVVGVGFGCKILPRLLHGNKKYCVTGHLGIATDTYNETGNIIQECSYSHISRQMLEAALSRYHGEILQTPPLYSALKLRGRRIADLTRAGISVDLNPRPVTCHAIQCTVFSPPSFTLEVHCGGGFYVRSLVHDLGIALGSCAHVRELHRFQQGPFMEQDMLDSNEWTMQNILIAIKKAKESHGEFLKRPRKKHKCEASLSR
ncbi:probable tRNA pseudouridine synthase 1 isoform X2 [Cryptotermes secundus]|uniref:probable tRNA pseudouridine synthase 1 isoform X2 n=1 Tax=Cryptotermes secundus TaxID=105785 RepID=UPI000CD7C1E7|nr:probable tRNA pseudouridine synthase 1 isoform X2 [Cryptotermes secundus]